MGFGRVLDSPLSLHSTWRRNGSGVLVHPGKQAATARKWFFCVTGVRDCAQSGGLYQHPITETYFQKLSEKAVSPHRATPGSVGYDLFTPIDFQIQPKEQKTVFIDIAIVPPEGYYAQLMS